MTESKDLIGDQCYIQSNRKVGRPTKLDESIIERICTHIREGNFLEVACAYEGIHKQSYYNWMKIGSKSDDPESLEKIFFDSIKEAEAASIMDMNARMRKHENGSWRPLAWRMQTRYQDKYGKHETLEVVQNPLEGLNDILKKSVKNLETKEEEPKADLEDENSKE